MGSLSIDQQKAVALASARARAADSGSDAGWADPAGKISAFVRNAANAATFNLADPAAAAIGAITPALNGYASTKPTYGERYDQLLNWSRGDTAAGQKAQPGTALAGSVAGGFLNPVTRALPVAQSIGGAALQGAGIGAAYGTGEGVTNQAGLGGAAKDATIGALTGGLLGGSLHGAGNIIKGATRNPDAALLNQNNIPTTIGQDLGGGFKRAEDAFTSLPYGGDAIIARQKEGVSGFNRWAENHTAAPIGVQVPAAVKSGNDAHAWLGNLNGKAYDAAWQGAEIPATQIPQLASDVASATDHFPNGLDPKSVQQDIKDRLLSLVDPNTGSISGNGLVKAKNWFAERASAGSNATQDQQDTAQAYKNVLTAIKGHVATSDPNRGALLKAADAMFARRMTLADASDVANASARGGQITPPQLSSSMLKNDQSLHKMAYVTGMLPGQDVVQAGQRTLPSAIPDSGTAIRRLLTGGLPTLAAGAAGGVAGGLGAVLPAAAVAALPMIGTRMLYSQTGQKAAKAALFGSPVVRAQIAKVVQRGGPGAYGILAALQQGGP